LDLNSFFGFDSSQVDFFGNPVPSRKSYDIGMYELPEDPPLPTTFSVYLPVNSSLP
jgi:hypothetical protein